ncbi:MAG: GNAT family N-acetyltransferase [Chloroflexota bacterium]|nr:GNAT family N-acetyltransferase [Chloroflexota bacterium]
MRRAPTVRAIAQTQMFEAGEIVGRTCADDPLVRYLAPDSSRRTRQALARVGVELVRYGMRHGEVFVAEAPVDGVAIWLPPAHALVTRPRLALTGLRALGAGLDPGSVIRLARAVSYLEALHRREAPPSHWYLLLLGVVPSRRRQGIGSALLQPIVTRADASNASCYVATMRAQSVLFYRRHGFTVLSEDNVPGGGPRFWTLVRAPGAAMADG